MFVALLFVALSLLPSLLPRAPLFQGLVSAVTTMIGYGVGVLGQSAWNFLELPKPRQGSSPDLILSKPDWLKDGQRGPDVSDRMTWFPLVTAWQVALDLTVAGSVPAGHGHFYTRSENFDAWVGLTEPSGWSPDDTEELRELLAGWDLEDTLE